MIRRDVRLPDGSAGWMLIAQVEHAHISAQLAERCSGRFGSQSCASIDGKTNPLAAVRAEVLAAIRCHDDGWAEWERAPRLDPKLGRPLSFMELDHAESIAIWSRSIATAEAYGPLAAWMVAGHFLRLLNKSDSAHHEQSAVQWRDDMERRRDAWLHAWQAVDPALRSRALADEALQWLWTFDEVSLWFCCICPNREGDSRTDVHSTIAGQGTPVELRLESTADKELGTAIAHPFRFDQNAVNIEAAGLVLPAAKYADPDELLAVGQPTTIHWRLQSALPKNQ
jgi:hypothetical protein